MKEGVINMLHTCTSRKRISLEIVYMPKRMCSIMVVLTLLQNLTNWKEIGSVAKVQHFWPPDI